MRNIIKGDTSPTQPEVQKLPCFTPSLEFPNRQAMASAVTAMAAIVAFPAPRSLQQAPAPLQLRQNAVSFVARPVRAHRRLVAVAASSPATPPDLASKVSESIELAKEACADDPVSGECAAAWDEVEELSAAASHARDRQKGADPLEEYCKDNPETDECRMYED